MNTCGRKFEYYKVDDGRLMVAEIRPVKCFYADDSNQSVKTTKWMDVNHWIELEKLIDDILKDYNENFKKFSKSGAKKMEHEVLHEKSGQSIKIGYFFKQYKNCGCTFMTPREDLSDADLNTENEDCNRLQDKGGRYNIMRYCADSLVVSVCPIVKNHKKSNLKLTINSSSPQLMTVKLHQALKLPYKVKMNSVSQYFSSSQKAEMREENEPLSDKTSIVTQELSSESKLLEFKGEPHHMPSCFDTDSDTLLPEYESLNTQVMDDLLNGRYTDDSTIQAPAPASVTKNSKASYKNSGNKKLLKREKITKKINESCNKASAVNEEMESSNSQETKYYAAEKVNSNSNQIISDTICSSVCNVSSDAFSEHSESPRKLKMKTNSDDIKFSEIDSLTPNVSLTSNQSPLKSPKLISCIENKIRPSLKDRMNFLFGRSSTDLSGDEIDCSVSVDAIVEKRTENYESSGCRSSGIVSDNAVEDCCLQLEQQNTICIRKEKSAKAKNKQTATGKKSFKKGSKRKIKDIVTTKQVKLSKHENNSEEEFNTSINAKYCDSSHKEINSFSHSNRTLHPGDCEISYGNYHATRSKGSRVTDSLVDLRTIDSDDSVKSTTCSKTKLPSKSFFNQINTDLSDFKTKDSTFHACALSRGKKISREVKHVNSAAGRDKRQAARKVGKRGRPRKYVNIQKETVTDYFKPKNSCVAIDNPSKKNEVFDRRVSMDLFDESYDTVSYTSKLTSSDAGDVDDEEETPFIGFSQVSRHTMRRTLSSSSFASKISEKNCKITRNKTETLDRATGCDALSLEEDESDEELSLLQKLGNSSHGHRPSNDDSYDANDFSRFSDLPNLELTQEDCEADRTLQDSCIILNRDSPSQQNLKKSEKVGSVINHSDFCPVVMKYFKSLTLNDMLKKYKEHSGYLWSIAYGKVQTDRSKSFFLRPTLSKPDAAHFMFLDFDIIQQLSAKITSDFEQYAVSRGLGVSAALVFYVIIPELMKKLLQDMPFIYEHGGLTDNECESAFLRIAYEDSDTEK